MRNAVGDKKRGVFAETDFLIDTDFFTKCDFASDVHACERIDKQLIRAFMLVPDIHAGFNHHVFTQRVLLKIRREIGDIAIRWNDGTNHALTRVPLGAGKISEVGARVYPDGGNARIAHAGLCLVNALLIFGTRNRHHTCCHVGQGCQCCLAAFAAHTDGHGFS